MSEIFGLITGLFLFICCVKAYILGLKHGKAISKGDILTMEINPVKTIIEKVEQHKQNKEQDQLIDELDTLLNFNQDQALQAIKAKR